MRQLSRSGEGDPRRIASYFNLGTSLAAWRRWLATGGKLHKYQPLTKRGGHAVALVGYTPTTFIVRNSWGTGWGDRGFGYATDAYAAAAFTEAYGIVL